METLSEEEIIETYSSSDSSDTTEESELSEIDDCFSPLLPPEELLEEKISLRDRSDTEISHWWKTLTLISYFFATIGGFIGSISIGNLLAAFQNRCIFYTKLSLINTDNIDWVNKTLTLDNFSEDKWGDNYDCEFCEFGSLFSSVFSGMLFAMFLQLGRGGVTQKGNRRSWEILPLALLITIIFFIITIVIFAKTTGGLGFFCDYILRNSHSPENITSCSQILSFHYPWDDFHTNLYLEYVLSQVGTSMVFCGWFAALNIIIFRCLFGIDFVAYRKRRYAVMSNLDDELNSETAFVAIDSKTRTKKIL